MKRYLFVLSVFLFVGHCFGQHKKVVKDSMRRDSAVHYKKVQRDSVAKDSTGLYKKIKNYSEKSKVTKLLHKWIFRSKGHQPKTEKSKNPPVDFKAYEGKIVRHIIIESNDPFGTSLTDSTRVPHSWLQKAGNNVHVKSKKMAIRKFLLFKENQTIDTLLIRETARLLREQNYIREVRIEPQSADTLKDSLDIVVKVLDSWSLLPKVRLSGSSMKLGVLERNFIGMGHRVDLDYSKRFSDGNTGFGTIYTIPNIKNSFIDVTGKYEIDLDHYYDRFVSVNRAFYSPLARWAGGALVQERYLARPLPDFDREFTDREFKYLYQDYWGGYAFHIFNGNSKEERTTNLVLSMRAFLLNYLSSPSEDFDKIDYFSDERFLLASVGLSTRQYVRDHYIFRDGETEDVPIGSVYSLTSGIQRKNQKNRLYLGLRTAYGNYFKWGFFSGNFEMGSFFSKSHVQQTTLSFKINYFSDLLDLNKGWKMRWFVKPQFVLGFSRKNSVADRIGLNENPYFRGVNSYNYIDYISKQKYIDYKNGNIPGFDSPVSGTRKYVLDLQAQFYAPWEFLGFRLNPFANLSVGYLAGKPSDYGSNKVYSALSVGLIVRNDYLVFDSFQLSLSYYPSMPGEGSNIFKTNSFRSEDYGFQDFEVGEPRSVIYE